MILLLMILFWMILCSMILSQFFGSQQAADERPIADDTGEFVELQVLQVAIQFVAVDQLLVLAGGDDFAVEQQEHPVAVADGGG